MEIDWRHLIILKAIVEAQIESAGMTAANMQRQAQGHSMAYDDQAFFRIIDNLNAIYEKNHP